MQAILHIAGKEFRGYFSSMIGYLVLALFLLITGYMFVKSVDIFVANIAQIRQMPWLKADPTKYIVTGIMDILIFIMVFIAPAVTMRSLTSESQQRTDRLLFTSPLSTSDIVLGKFLGIVGFLCLMIGVTLYVPLMALLVGSIDVGPIASGYLGMVLTILLFSAIGLFFSSLTRHQIIAFILPMVTLLLLTLLGTFDSMQSGSGNSSFQSLLSYLSYSTHLSPFFAGKIDTKDLIYFLSLGSLFIFLTHQRLESRRWQ